MRFHPSTFSHLSSPRVSLLLLLLVVLRSDLMTSEIQNEMLSKPRLKLARDPCMQIRMFLELRVGVENGVLQYLIFFMIVLLDVEICTSDLSSPSVLTGHGSPRRSMQAGPPETCGSCGGTPTRGEQQGKGLFLMSLMMQGWFWACFNVQLAGDTHESCWVLRAGAAHFFSIKTLLATSSLSRN